MNHSRRLFVLLTILTTSGFQATPASAQPRDGGPADARKEPSARAYEALKRLGGKLREVRKHSETQGVDFLAGLDVDLRDSLVVDGALEYLEPLRVLSLDLGTLDVTAAGLAHLEGQTGLETLSLRGTKVVGDGLASLEPLIALRKLDLGGTPVGDAGLRHLRGLVNLDELDLAGTAVEGPGLAFLAGLPRLSSLTLPAKLLASFDDERPLSQLKNLKGLKRVVFAESGPAAPGGATAADFEAKLKRLREELAAVEVVVKPRPAAAN